jgi:chemotaxis regulatin CheY-phosphate phosphatase CheZ
MSTRILVEREAVDRMILIGMDVDRYQTQVIPDLQQRVGELTRALKDLVRAVGAARLNPALASQVDGSTDRAQKVLEAGLPQTNGGQL